ncbi:TetR/AcrR family transcriptional regulator [Archangium violaceum]|uniref:TetR/AcrR family transcriptional regulator n=1 Tax=Archangium violaceum TaxID=83451 RepID=UPI00194E2446|nr:TetR/AcrR family transcriptional regulator [Archangium violaceum]QRO01515.1 TetR/AcrR family transcriptional regulator [Archangium violaceum]
MPLPRFDRLPADDKAAILSVARAHFARDGYDGASYNKIIHEAGISKTSAYHYFDGKSDLFATVLADCVTRAQTEIGDWTPATDAAGFWAQLTATSHTLVQHLNTHPDDRSVLAQAPRSPEPNPWTQAMVDDAIRLRLVNPAERTLITVATQGVLDALDDHALDHPARASEIAGQLPILLARLWAATAPAP